MDTQQPKNEPPDRKTAEPIPDLNYEEPYDRSLFQTACFEFVKAQGYTNKIIGEWTLGLENHVGIPLLRNQEVKSRDVTKIPEEATHFGILVGPQGFYQTSWLADNTNWCCNYNSFLRHPAELAEVRAAHASDPFSERRSYVPEDTSSIEAFRLHHLSDTPLFEAPLNPQYQKQRVKASSLIHEVYLLLEEEPFKGRLLPLSALSTTAKGIALLKELSAACSSSDFDFAGSQSFPFWHLPEQDYPEHWEGDLSKFHLLANQTATDLPDALAPLSFRDVVLGFAGDLTSPQLLGTLHYASRAAPKLVVRPNLQKVSLMRFLDLATVELPLHAFLDPPGTWAKKASKTIIELERDTMDQVRASLSFRQAIHEYGNFTNVATYASPPDEELDKHHEELHLDEIERRAQVLRKAHGRFVVSGYKEQLADPPPRLPHFLEIAYQRFLDSRSERSRREQSRNMLNLLGRSLLFFVLEDAHHAEVAKEKLSAIDKELRGGKPPSDGGLFNLQLSLIRAIEPEQRDKLVTKQLMEALPDLINTHLFPLVNKRNRANHPPYDEDAFIAEADAQIPPVIEALRKVFKNLELLVPIHFKSDAGDLVVNAKSLMGNQFEYPENSFLSSLDYDQTPTDSLLLCFVRPSQSRPSKDNAQAPAKSPEPSSVPSLTLEQRASVKDPHIDTLVEALFNAEKAHDNLLKARDKALTPRIDGAVPLHRFFTKKTGYKEMIMTGIFDRVSKGSPVFEFVEE